MNIKEILQKYVTARVQSHVGKRVDASLPIDQELRRRKQLMDRRQAKVIKSNAICQIDDIEESSQNSFQVMYTLLFNDLIKHDGQFYIEEYEELRKASIMNNQVTSDVLLSQTDGDTEIISEDELSLEEEDRNTRFVYDRRAAVRYAEQWWDSYNPKYKKFEVDCTNFISQCLHAGGAPMSGYPNRNKGWWMRNNSWSYSWSVAHAFRWYLASSKSGLRAVEKERAEELMPGDVICYDFQGDGRYDHTTIVVAKDRYGMPLVNAHTTNSRMRYWAYEDSTAYTPNIKYKFFHIIDG